MSSVALIGPDGAGKTTLTRMLEQSGLLPFRYLYMGVDIGASNLALPTSRLVQRLKEQHLGPGSSSRRGGDARDQRRGSGSGRHRATIRGFLRLANRLAEEWFRQFASWYYQVRGFTVLYDRHFVFDFAPEIAGGVTEPLDKRLHRWCLLHLYPRPGLVVFLDAPGALLFARKGESTPDELERRRQAFLRVGEKIPGFVRVDATRPLDDVYADVVRHVVGFCGRERHRAPAPEGAR
jgi:hypothetical protein